MAVFKKTTFPSAYPEEIIHPELSSIKVSQFCQYVCRASVHNLGAPLWELIVRRQPQI